MLPPCLREEEILIRLFCLCPVGAADGDIGSIFHLIALIFCIDPAYESQIDTIALVRTEKGMSHQLRQQGGQLAVKLKGSAVFYGKDHMMRLLLQI